MAEKDPLKITLAEAAQLYNKEVGVSKISTFGKKGGFAKYGDTPLVDIFKGKQGSRILDKMLSETTTPGTFNKLTDNLRLITTPVRRRISSQNPNNPVLNTLPALEAADEQTKIVFGERKAVETTAETAIDTTKRKGWKEFFDKLDVIADDPKHPKQALANAFRASLYSGNRIGLMTGLQGSEYLIDQGALSVEPQTKTVGVDEDQETRVGASKTGGVRKKAIPYTVPLNENAHAYLQQQLKINANDPEIKTYIAEQTKLGKAPIFVHKVVTGEGDKRKVKFVTGTKLNGLISDMLGDITVSENIIVDNKSKKGYNSLFPKELKNKTQGKWGSSLSRNIHASIAINELGVNQQMIDFLHGRSTTSGAALRGQTAKLGYAKRPVGTFFPAERDAQQSIGNWINKVQGKSAVQIPDVQNKVSRANYALQGFFDPPAETGPVTLDTPENKSKLISDLISGKVSMSEAMTEARNKIKTRLTKPMDGGTKSNLAILGGISTASALMSGDAEAGAEVGTQMVGEEILERGTIETLKKAGLATRVANPVGLGLTIAGTTISTTGMSGFEKELRLAKQLGVDRNTILALPLKEREKLFSLAQDFEVKELAEQQKKISLGEQMKNLSMNKPNVTNSFMDSDISDNQF